MLGLLSVTALGAGLPALHAERERWARDEAISGHVAAGDRALAASDYELAGAAYARALELHPGDPSLILLRERARAYVAADHPETLKAGDLAELRYDAEALLARDPAHASAYLTARAVVEARLGDAKKAAADLEAALARDPKSPLASFILAEQEAAAGDADKARAHYRAVLERRPDHVGSLLGLGRLEVHGGKLEGGIDALKSALGLREDPEARLTLVDALVAKGALPEALAEARKGVAQSPQAAESHRSLGLVLQRMDRLDEAEPELRAALSAKPSAQGYVDLGNLLGQEKRPKDALSSYKKALREEPGNPFALLGAGVAAEDAGLPDEARDHLQKLLASRPPAPSKELAALREMAKRRLDALTAPAPPPR